jgi:hypothetical protein
MVRSVARSSAKRSDATALGHGYPLITRFIGEADCTFHHDVAEAFYGTYRDAGGTIDAHEAFLAGLFQALFLMWFANTDERWTRVQWAVAHEDELCSTIDRVVRQ